MKLVLKSVAPRQGWQWMLQGVRTFGRQPLVLTGLFGTFLFLVLVSMLVPLLGTLVVLAAMPLLSLVMMMGTAAVVRGQPAPPSLFLAPFRTDAQRRKRLLSLCAAYGVLTLLVLTLSDLMDGGALDELQALMASGKDSAEAREQLQVLMDDPRLRSGLLVRFGLTGLLSVPFWHAPALVWWGQQGVAQSLFSSTLALWRCKGAFAVYLSAWASLVVVCSTVLGMGLQAIGGGQFLGVLALPMGLTLSVMFYASLYFMFVQTFGVEGDQGQADDEDGSAEPDLPPAA